jgi:hypothetical protein
MHKEKLETKPQLTKKFIIGVVMIICSFALGKLVFIPLIIFPGNATWRTSMIFIYIFSWLILLSGLAITGVEGYKLAKHKYREYSEKTISHVKNHSKNAVHQTARVAGITVDAIRKPIQKPRRIRLK